MNDETKPFGPAALLRVVLTAALLVLTLLPVRASASSPRTVIPVGRAVGIKLFSDGVVVVGTSEIATSAGNVNPAKACGLREGDIITHINSTEVDSIEEVSALLQELEGEPMSIRAIRDEKQVQLTASAVLCSADGAYKLGAWIRDSMAGIGTVTYYDPDRGVFGALGHGINDVDTALLMPLESGSILPATVASVCRGASGAPGQLKGAFETGVTLGTLYSNTGAGVFGSVSDGSRFTGTPVETASRDQVHTGGAVILSNISGDATEEFDIEILKVFKEDRADSRDFVIRVTDPELLEQTGGIVQGMSGSPILQDGRLIGAVTHVLVDDPTQGYAVSIQRMLHASGAE